MSFSFYRFFLRPLLFSLAPEQSHALVMGFMSGICRSAIGRWAVRLLFSPPKVPAKLAGLALPNPIGLAAGFDKDARWLRVWKTLGFGFVEVGTITPKPQSGHPKPRLFRLSQDKALLNRMGFNNQGMDAIAWRLRHRPQGLIVGANIGKNQTSNDSTADYLACLDKLYPYVDYFTLNVSSPNTTNLRALQIPEALKRLLIPLLAYRNKQLEHRPFFVKLSPDLALDTLGAVAKLAKDLGIEGLIIGNTSIDRGGIQKLPKGFAYTQSGGLSGIPLRHKTLKLLRAIQNNPSMERIGVGGIFEPKDLKKYQQVGCVAVQIYTGLIYQGPNSLKKLARAWHTNSV